MMLEYKRAPTDEAGASRGKDDVDVSNIHHHGDAVNPRFHLTSKFPGGREQTLAAFRYRRKMAVEGLPAVYLYRNSGGPHRVCWDCSALSVQAERMIRRDRGLREKLAWIIRRYGVRSATRLLPDPSYASFKLRDADDGPRAARLVFAALAR